MGKRQPGYKTIIVSFLAGAAYKSGGDTYDWVKKLVNDRKKNR